MILEMKINPLFFLKTVFVTVAAAASLAGAQTSGGNLYYDVKAAVNILEKEIERDKTLIAPVMSGNQLRKVRAMLADGLKKKEPLAKSMGKHRRPAIDKAIKIFISTAEDERKITKGATVSHRLKRQAYYTIKNNIPRKETALLLFKNWNGN